MLDYVSLVQYRIFSAIVSFFQPGTGLTGCWTLRHFYINIHGHQHRHAALTWACNLDMQHGHEHALWTWTNSMDMDMHHSFGHAAWTMDKHGCQNAGMLIKSSVRHLHSGIMVSPVLLVTY
jgi:hypothetical protein